MCYFVYILQSDQDGSFYVGYTTHPELRLAQHNRGEAQYTSRKIPWRLVYLESCSSKTEAIKRERFLKRQRNRSFYERLIREAEDKK
jgi:putative endonuclease